MPAGPDPTTAIFLPVAGDFRHFNMVLRRFPFGGESLQPADGHGRALFVEDAFFFALLFLGTDPAANGRQAILFFQYADGGGKIRFGDFFDKSGNVDFHRTTFDAKGFFTLQAAFGFADGQFRRIPRATSLKFRFLICGGCLGISWRCRSSFFASLIVRFSRSRNRAPERLPRLSIAYGVAIVPSSPPDGRRSRGRRRRQSTSGH